MNSLETLTAFFGWMTIINIGIYLISAIAIWLAPGWAFRINSRIFGIEESVVREATLNYIGNYKLAITVLCFAPWAALKIIA